MGKRLSQTPQSATHGVSCSLWRRLPFVSRASLPPFHCGGMVPLRTTRFMSSHCDSASLSPPVIQISLAISSGPTARCLGMRRNILATFPGVKMRMLHNCIAWSSSRIARRGFHFLNLLTTWQRRKVLCPSRETFIVITGQSAILALHSRNWRGLGVFKPPQLLSNMCLAIDDSVLATHSGIPLFGWSALRNPVDAVRSGSSSASWARYSQCPLSL